MKISYNWLKQYVDFVLTPKDLGEVLTGCGLEVEDITPFESVKGGLEGVVVGKVLEAEKHPDADKLRITKVDAGTGEILQIVCGAPNVAAGQMVPVALVGAALHPFGSEEKIVIKKAKIRGVESFGMICAEDELGLSAAHDGIMVLDAATPIGTKAADYFKVEKDYLIGIGLTPNRADANSHIGVARDIVAALNIAYKSKVTLTKPDISAYKQDNSNLTISVDVQDTAACPRYSGVTISGLKVADSPQWLKNKLAVIGVRSINNVVDVTNYVLHEYGQPLHAFDAAKISGNKVVVKRLAGGTKFKALDGTERTLTADDLMICNAEDGMCIAGVFGGAESGVSEITTTIFLESAYFTPTGIRKTANHHNLRTDAATHFEKGCDPNITVTALKRAALLIKEVAGGEVSSDIIDIYPKPIDGWRFEVSFERMMRLAGFKIDKQVVKDLLNYLEITIEKEEGDNWNLFVPAFKTDVTREADVVEEIIRIYGYNSFTIPTTLKSTISLSPKVDNFKMQNLVADMLTGAGFNELWTNSVTQSKFEQDEQMQQQQVKLLNSQTAELDSLRASMLYSGLEVIAYNQNRKASDLRLYEFGTTYHKIADSYKQNRHLVLYLTGKTLEDNWSTKAEKYNFYYLKGFVMNVLSRLGMNNFTQEYNETSPYSFSLVLKDEETVVAQLGVINKKTLNAFDIKNEVFYADINWDYLLEKSQFVKASFTELPKFPAVRRDLALLVGEELKFEQIEKIAQQETKKFLQDVSLFDVYKGDKIEQGKKSYAVSFVFMDTTKTLTDQEIDKLMSKLMSKLESELGAVVRK